MDLHSFFADGDVGRTFVNPTAGVVVIDSLFIPMHGDMGVSAENALGLVAAGECERSG